MAAIGKRFKTLSNAFCFAVRVSSAEGTFLKTLIRATSDHWTIAVYAVRAWWPGQKLSSKHLNIYAVLVLLSGSEKLAEEKIKAPTPPAGTCEWLSSCSFERVQRARQSKSILFFREQAAKCRLNYQLLAQKRAKFV